MSVIFNFDQTLIDSSIAKEYIDNHMWNKAFPLIPQFLVYDHILETLKFLSSKNVDMAIVSASTSHYCRRVIYTFQLPIKNIRGFYEGTNTIERIISYFNPPRSFRGHYNPTHFITNIPEDIIITKGKYLTIGCGWGNKSNNELIASKPEYYFDDPLEFLEFIRLTYNDYPRGFKSRRIFF